jgi:hypothetical protein
MRMCDVNTSMIAAIGTPSARRKEEADGMAEDDKGGTEVI